MPCSRRLLIAVLSFLTAFISILPAQTSVGRISGTVIDASGAAIPNVSVSIKNTDTQNTRTVTTDGNGFYVATNLPIGPYTVEISVQGFQRQARTGLALVADGRLTADFQLQVGDVSQSVEVSAQAGETINTVSGELSRVVETKQVENLALNGRNYTQLMTLVPGAVVTNPDTFSVTTSLSATNQNINGNRGDSNNLTVDGAFNLVAGSNGSLMNNVGADFIQEVKVQTSNFSAEYGRTAGAAFNIVTKNGTNQFHGAAFEFLRNDALDARNFFAPQKNKLRFNDFGYDVGGPIKKDKLFFFWGEEWKRLRQVASPTRVTVPTTAMLNGDFSGQPQLFFPGTTTPIPGNNISSLISTDGRAIANVYKLMSQQSAAFNNSAVSNNLTLSPSNPLDFRQELLRLDYHLNDKHTVYGRWIQDSNSLIDPYGTFSGSNLPTTPTTRNRPGESFLIAETWLPSPSIINEFRANASWASQNIPPYGNTWQRDTYGFQFPQLYAGGNYDNGIPNVSITGYANFRGPSFALHSPSTDIQISDNVSIIRSPHIFKMGFAYIRDRVDQNGRPVYTGNVSFDINGNLNTTGNPVADALIGNYRTYQEASSDPMGFFRFSQPGAYIQDSWKVSRKLSFELGVRWEYMQPMYVQANNMANFVRSLYNPAQAVTLNRLGQIIPGSGNVYNGLIRAGDGVPDSEKGRVPGSDSAAFNAVPAGAPRGLWNGQHIIAPRFGFAYALDTKTVLRGGYGIFYARPQGNMTFGSVNVPPILQAASLENGNLSNPAGGSNVLAPIANINAIDPNLKVGSSQQYSFGVQREFPRSVMVEASYVGNLGRNLLRAPDINFPAFADLVANAALPSNQRAAVNTLRPYKGYSQINMYLSDSTSNYHALQLYGSKRAGAVQLTASYTWSKALADSSDQGSAPENYPDRHYSYGPTSYDRRHAFVATYVWEMPRLRNWQPVARAVLGGWQSSGIIRLQSGPFFTVSGSTAIGTRRADYLGGDVKAGTQNINNWINLSAFAAASNRGFGSAGVGTVEGPGLQSYDLSLAKNFAFHERYNFRLQADFLNAFNVANFYGLNTTVTDRAFGTLSSAYPSRNIQLGLKFNF